LSPLAPGPGLRRPAQRGQRRWPRLQPDRGRQLSPERRLAPGPGRLYRQKLEAGEQDSDYKLNSYLASAFAQYRQDRWWADAALTAGHLDYSDLKRTFALGVNDRSEKGDTDGEAWAMSGRLGYNLAADSSNWQLAPFISADYARVKVDGYDEKKRALDGAGLR
jgi:outer membrane lipase/esterase